MIVYDGGSGPTKKRPPAPGGPGRKNPEKTGKRNAPGKKLTAPSGIQRAIQIISVV